MKKSVVVTLVIFTFIFFVAHRYLIITSCNTYNLKIYNNALYVKYGIRTNEKISNKFIGNLYGCRRYKILSLNLNQKLKLENKTLLTKINEDILWKNGVYNIYFSIRYGFDKDAIPIEKYIENN